MTISAKPHCHTIRFDLAGTTFVIHVAAVVLREHDDQVEPELHADFW